MADSSEPWRGTIFVLFKKGVTAERRDAILKFFGIEYLEGFSASSLTPLVKVPADETETWVSRLKEHPEIESAEPNQETRPGSTRGPDE